MKKIIPVKNSSIWDFVDLQQQISKSKDERNTSNKICEARRKGINDHKLDIMAKIEQDQL